MTTADRIKTEAGHFGDRFSEWLERTLAQTGGALPDRDALRRQAEQMWEGMTAIGAQLPGQIARRLPGCEPPGRRRARMAAGISVGMGIGAAAMYFLDPHKGAERRARLAARVSGLRSSSDSRMAGNGHRARSASSLSTPGHDS